MFKKIAAVMLVAASINLDIAWAYPSGPGAEGRALAAPSIVQKHDITITQAMVAVSVARYLLGDPAEGARPLPIKYMPSTIRAELGRKAEGFMLESATLEEGLVTIPYKAGDGEAVFEAALSGTKAAGAATGTEWLATEKYFVRKIPADREKPGAADVSVAVRPTVAKEGRAEAERKPAEARQETGRGRLASYIVSLFISIAAAVQGSQAERSSGPSIPQAPGPGIIRRAMGSYDNVTNDLYETAAPYAALFRNTALTNAFTGMSRSYQGVVTPPETANEVGEHGSSSYDMSVVGRILLSGGDTNILDTLVYYAAKSDDIHNPVFHNNTDFTNSVGVPIKGLPHTFVRITGRNEPNWWEQWPWDVDTGAAANQINYALDAYARTNKAAYLNFARSMADSLLMLQDPDDGGFRYGPIGVYHNNGQGGSDDYFFWNLKSTEKNEQIMSAMTNLYSVTRMDKYRDSAYRTWDWMKTMYNHQEHLFYPAVFYNWADWVKPPLGTTNEYFATDVTAYAPIELMADDAFFGADEAARDAEIRAMFEATERRTAFTNAAGLPVLFRFSGSQSGDYGSVEFSSQMALAYLRVAQLYASRRSDDALYYLARYDTLISSLAGFFRPFSGNGSWLVAPYAQYADGTIAPNVPTGTGYDTSPYEAAAASTYFGFAKAGYDPLKVDGGPRIPRPRKPTGMVLIIRSIIAALIPFGLASAAQASEAPLYGPGVALAQVSGVMTPLSLWLAGLTLACIPIFLLAAAAKYRRLRNAEKKAQGAAADRSPALVTPPATDLSGMYEALSSGFAAIYRYPDKAGLAKIRKGYDSIAKGDIRRTGTDILTAYINIPDGKLKDTLADLADSVAAALPADAVYDKIGKDTYHIAVVPIQDLPFDKPENKLTGGERAAVEKAVAGIAAGTEPYEVKLIGLRFGADGGVIAVFEDEGMRTLGLRARVIEGCNAVCGGKVSQARKKPVVSLTLMRIFSPLDATALARLKKKAEELKDLTRLGLSLKIDSLVFGHEIRWMQTEFDYKKEYRFAGRSAAVTPRSQYGKKAEGKRKPETSEISYGALKPQAELRTDAEKAVASLIILARRAERERQKLIIGLETDWVPGMKASGSYQKQAIFALMREISAIGETLRSMGLDNVKVVRGSADGLAAELLKEAAASRTGARNIVVLASKDTIGSDSFSALRNTEASEKPFFAAIDPSELAGAYERFGEATDRQLYIRLTQMLHITLALAAGKDPPQLPIILSYDKQSRIIIFMPRAEPLDYEILKKTYDAELKALVAA